MGKGQGSESGDWIKLGTSAIGATAGAIFGGPQGATMGWQAGSSVGDLGNKFLGQESSGQGIAGQANNWGGKAATVANVGMGINSAMAGGGGGLNAYESQNTAGGANTASGAAKGFSGTTSAGKGVDVGGTNAWGQALGAGKGNPTVPTENGFGKLGNLLTKSMDTMGAIMPSQQGQSSEQGNLQPMQMAQPSSMAAPMNLSSVIAAQLMNPSAQNRLAYMHPGRM